MVLLTSFGQLAAKLDILYDVIKKLFSLSLAWSPNLVRTAWMNILGNGCSYRAGSSNNRSYRHFVNNTIKEERGPPQTL